MKSIFYIKFLLSSISIIILNCNIFCQEMLNYGVEAGGSWSAFARNYNSFTKYLSGFTGGGFIRLCPTPIAGFSLEVLYSQQGAASVDPSYIQYNSTSNLQRWSADIRIHKIEAPVLLNIYPPGFENDVYPVIMLGGSLGYTFKASAKNFDMATLPNYTYIFEEQPQDVLNTFNTIDYAGVIGFEINFKGDYLYSIDLKYRIGLANINRSVYNYINNKYAQNAIIITFKAGL